MKDQCVAQGLFAEGNAAGHLDPNDLDGLPVGPFQQILGWRPKGIGAIFGYDIYCAIRNSPLTHNFLSCVFTATLGMITVAWYAMGNHDMSESEMEEEIRKKQAKKENRTAWVRSVFKKD